ncbi:Immunoglobulin E-set [Phytophthora cactorum]|nr:Immunoglobulin E-set [Phytophthora cactorum]
MLPIRLSISGGTYFETGFSFTVFEPVVLTGVVPNAIIPTRTDRIKLECLDVFPSRDWQCNFDSPERDYDGKICVQENDILSDTSSTITTHRDSCCQTPQCWYRVFDKCCRSRYSSNAGSNLNYSPKSRGVFMSSAASEDIVDYVTITGKNFVPFRRIDCRFGALCSQGTFISSTQVRCLIPMSHTPRRASLAISFNEVDYLPATELFEYILDFKIESISPINGAVSGGTVVHIYGGEFAMNEAIVCKFGYYNSDQYAVVISSTEIVCTSPSVLEIGKIDVGIWSVTRRLTGTLSNAFTYTKEPVVLMVSPMEALEKMETLFDVYGRGFVRSPLLGCSFNGNQTNTATARQRVHAIWVSSTHIKCFSPPTNTSVGDVQIGVTNNGVDFVYSSRNAMIHFRTQFDVAEIYPLTGSTEGGTTVFISGKHFDNVYRYWCRFGDNTEHVGATIVSDEELICISPSFAFSTGEVVIYLSVNGRDFVSTNQTFSYQVKPQIFKISPTRGSMDASTMVTVTGAGFYSESPLCRFGDDIVQAYVQSDSELMCIAPTNRFAEAVPVEVSLNDGVDFTQNGVQYTYMLSPRIRQITPVSGPAAGGTLVQIAGLNLYSSKLTKCCFEDRSHCTQGWLLNATVVECVTPPSPTRLSVARAGSKRVPILLALNGQDFVTLKMQFEYVLDVTIEDISPVFGDIDGGTKIFLHGRHLRYSTGLECRFDNIRTLATYWNDSTISCEAPPHPVGNTNLSMSLNGQDFTLATANFTYLRLPSVYTLTPSTGPLLGGYSIRVNGGPFVNTSSIICQFAQDAEILRDAVAAFESPAGVSCTVPSGRHSGRGLMSLYVNGISAARLQNLEFLYYEDVVLNTLEPWLCDSSGGCRLVIFGANFGRDAALECCFGFSSQEPTCVPAEFISDTRLNCISPPFKRVGSVEVSIRSYGVEVSSQSLVLEVHHPIVLDNVYPMTGTYRGGTKIKISGWKFMFTPQLSCCFNDTQIPATFINSSMIECSTPSLGKISPNTGTRLGGTTVVLQGENFKVNESTCYFGSTPATASEVMSDTQMTCTSPAQSSPQRLQVVVADNNLDYSTSPVFFTYVAAEEVKSVSPVRLPSIKGGKITVTTENALHCSTPILTPGFYYLYISNDGKLKSQSFDIIELVQPPLIASVGPLVGDMEGGELVSFVGSRLNTVSHCRFGNVYTSAYVVSPNLLQCESPSQATFGDVVVKLWDHGAEIPSQEIMFKYRTPEQATKRRLTLMKDEDNLLPIPTILSIDPPEVPIIGGTLITVRGLNFSNSLELACRFGSVVVGARYHSSGQVVCTTPRLQPNQYTFQASNDGRVFSNSPTSILLYTDAFVEYISPTHGLQTGGTAVTIYGMHFRKGSHLRCKFGDLEAVQVVKFVSSTEVVCISPPQRDMTTVVRVAVTNNNVAFTPNPVFFTYTSAADLVSVTPKFGGISGDTEVQVRGYNLEINYDGVVTCRIGGINCVGEILASNVVKCVTPAVKQPGKQPLQVSVNELDFTTSSLYFEYVEDIVIHELIPNLGPSVDANTVMTVRGTGFINSSQTMELMHPPVRFVFVSQGCVGIATISNKGLKEGGTTVFFQGRNFVNHTLLACRFGEILSPATYLSESAAVCVAPRQLVDLRSTNGTVSVELTSNQVDFTNTGLKYTYLQKCPSSQFCTNGNIQSCPNGTICEPHGSTNFSLCAPGTFQPRQNQVTCLPCPVGFFCPDHGMSKPLLCRAGMVCDEHGLRTPVKGCPSGHYCRKGTKTANTHDFTTNFEYSTDKETQLAIFVENSRTWALIPRVAPAIDSRRIEHPPVWLQANNFSAPQKCYPGFFCPRGSSTPEGKGPCPTGHYCPNDVDAIVCPSGQYCPGVGNLRPRDCYPGTYNPFPKQSNCSLCLTGHVCPQPKMLKPVLCPAGFVCISTGLAAPVLLCPAGYICREGTRTLDPSDTNPFRPMPCPKGTYCLGGVAHNTTIDWVPSRPEGAVAPQICTEGTYCEEATPTLSGTGVCYAGHYCSPGSSAPIQAQVGSFAGTTGSVVSTMCFPGTYTPLKATVECEICPAGHSCPGYGTYIPSSGMITMASSLPCAAGYVCGEGTNRRAQFDHLCPAGHYCSSATPISQQYANVCEKGNICVRGTKTIEKNKSKCPDGKFCPLGTANSSSIYISCPSGTWSSSSEDELVDCSIRAVPICDKLPERQYYPQFSYDFQGTRVTFDSTVETSRTGEVEVVNVVYPVNESASVPFWKNDTVDTIRVCPQKMAPAGGVLLTVIGRNFQNTGRLVCKFQLPKSPFSQISPAFFKSSTRVTCRAPPFIGNDTAATGTSFSQAVKVSVSNYGVHFSTTTATFNIVSTKQVAALNLKQLMTTCLKRAEDEEGFRNNDKAWFALTGLGKAKLSFDFRHLPGDLVYDEHYKIAIFVKNSTCEDQTCDYRGVVLPSGPDIETSPCHRPVELPRWFLSTAVNKNDLLNITLLALEDVTFKVEIHVMYGLYASVAPFFVNSTTVKLKTPTRSNVTQGVKADTRPLSRSISYEAKLVPRDYTFLIAYFGGDGDYTSPPLNLPPKYEAYERGRVLMSHNVSSTAKVPLVADPYKDVVTDTSYWLMPYGSAALTHEKVVKYRETFQEMYVDTSDTTGSQYLFKFDKILTSYLPFFSNCMEYDSYIPLFDLFESDQCQLPAMTSETGNYGRTWWRRKFPPLPNQDDIRYVGPLDVAQEPTADICMMNLQCHYEEDLATADVTPRWFEQSIGTVLYYFLREPGTLADYLRGGQYYDEILDQYGSDYFIPLTVDNSAAQSLEGDCSTLCFPRTVTLNVAYYQLDSHVKRIIMATLVYDNYDRDSSNTAYTFSVNLNPLNYFQLVIQFAFEKQVFVGLFFVLGSMMTVGALIFWIVVRISSYLQSPPRFRFWTVFALIAPPPSVGVAMASLPIFSVVFSFYLLLSGDKFFSSSGYWLTDNIVRHFLETKINPEVVAETRKGRIGVCFLFFGLYLIVLGTRIFLPKPIAISEKVMAEQNDRDAQERSIWWPTQWKRANMIFASIMLGLFLVLMLEFSFWSSFGDYMFYVIVAQEIINAIMEGWIESQLKEALLMAPLVSALSLIGGIMTFGATDFGDFVLGNTLDFGMMILMRVYTDTVIEAISDFVKDIARYVWGKMKTIGRGALLLFRSFTRSTAVVAADAEAKKEKTEGKEEAGKAEESGEVETVEPIIDFYAMASMERLALFYQPVLILIMMFFREEVMLPILYNIREKDMEIYLWYSLIILLFQLVTEVFVLNVVEISQGWKLYDYLVYCRYRFLQREKRWKGMEPNLDECIDEGLRTLDQMCFSSQFFMMCTIHITGIVFFVVGIEIMARASYNLFGDPAMPLLLAFVLAASVFVRALVMFLAVRFEIWKIKHENTAWLAAPDEDDEFGVPRWGELEKIKGASHEAYMMNQRITSDTFRNKFLNYNRSWLVNQLPSILTPRTLRRARPYLLAQFAKILDSLNPQVSDDEEDDDGRPRFGPVTLSAPSRTIIVFGWLEHDVEMSIPIEVLGDKFDSQNLAEEFDAAAWKDFFAKHQKFKTLCLNCIVHLKTTGQLGDLRGIGRGDDGVGDEGLNATPLNAASYALLQKWYRTAQDRVFGKSGKRRQQLDVSDDEEETMQHRFEWTRQPVELNAASTALARKWLLAARHKLREPGRARDQLPTNLTALHPSVRGGATPVPKPAMKMGAAGGEAVKASKMRRK